MLIISIVFLPRHYYCVSKKEEREKKKNDINASLSQLQLLSEYCNDHYFQLDKIKARGIFINGK